MGALTHGSLFSGIGGAELAAEWNGIENVFHCDINPFGRAVLDYWYPNAKSYDDITKTDFTEWRGKIDILSGGFPCQPFSHAGQRKGSADDRYLWPHMCRVVREVQPRYVIGENVVGITSMVEPVDTIRMEGEANLFGKGDDIIIQRYRYTIERVCEDLEKEGYAVQPIVIPACAVGAPHPRARVWFLAKQDQTNTEGGRFEDGWNARGEGDGKPKNISEERHAANTIGGRLQEFCDTDREGANDEVKLADNVFRVSRGEVVSRPSWVNFPTQPPVLGGTDGLPFDVDDLSIPYARLRAETVKAMGNAWCPQVAYEIFKAIKEDIRNEQNEDKI